MSTHRSGPPRRRGGASPRALPLAGGLALALVLAVPLLVARPAAAQAPAATRIAYVDMKRLLDNAPQVKAARELLRQEFARRDAELKAQEAKLADLEQRQRRDAAILPRDAAAALEREIDTLRRGIKRLKDTLREELSTRSAEELNARWPRIHDAVIEYARENGLDLVVESPVIYASPTIDVTDEVLQRLERDFAATPGDAR